MGCCGEAEKYKRMKDFNHARIMISYEAHLTNRVLAMVKLTHGRYGEYYGGIDYDTARAKGMHILRKLGSV